MGLNEQKGNMYPFVTHTINFIKGKCPHQCSYCYMQDNPIWKKEQYLDEKEFKTDLGSGNFIFVGSSCDMFADVIPDEWLRKIFDRFFKSPLNPDGMLPWKLRRIMFFLFNGLMVKFFNKGR